jgi:hypothetical protein
MKLTTNKKFAVWLDFGGNRNSTRRTVLGVDRARAASIYKPSCPDVVFTEESQFYWSISLPHCKQNIAY